jgi:hypothetical protein
VKELSQISGKSSSGIHIGLKEKRCGKQGLVGACGCQSKKLFQQAESCASSFSYEKVWLIFDLDAHGRPDQDEIIRRFIETIRKSDDRINTAWNIPFFEYWMVLHKKYLTATSPSAIENDVKKALTSAIERQLPCKKELAVTIKKNCQKPIPTICTECLDKPYCNSLVGLDGLAGVKEAYKRSIRCHEENCEYLKKQNYKDISCCSNMHTLISALLEYFDIESIDNLVV